MLFVSADSRCAGSSIMYNVHTIRPTVIVGTDRVGFCLVLWCARY